MAVITISNAGGNFNATGTWVGGVVPTSADDIVGATTSGQLTVNVSSNVRSIDFTYWTQTLTMNATLQVSGASTTNTLGASMSFAGTGLLNMTAQMTIIQNTTNRIPYLRFLTQNKTLNTDVKCVNFDTGAANIGGSGNLYVSGNFLDTSPSTVLISGNSSGHTGNKIILDGTGQILSPIRSEVEINTTGTYSFFSVGAMLRNAGTFSYVAGNLVESTILLAPSAGQSYTCGINCDVRIDNVILNLIPEAVSFPNATVNLLKTLNCLNLSTSTEERWYTTDNTFRTYIFTGRGLSASNLFLYPAQRGRSNTTSPNYIIKGPSIKLNSDFTHTIGDIMAIGGFDNNKPFISSITASTTANINLLSKTASQIVNYDFTDITSTGEEIVAIGGTLTRTSNVTNIYPTGGTGGGVSGGSFTFVQ